MSQEINSQLPKTLRAKIKVSKSIEGIKNIIEKYSSLKTDNKNLKHHIEEKETKEKRKDKELEEMSNKIDEYIMTQDYLKHLTSVQRETRSEVEQDQLEIAKYCNDLKQKFSNIEKTVSDYENVIAKLENENKQIESCQQSQVDQITTENSQTQSQVEDRLKVVKGQRHMIRELELKTEFILRDNEEMRNGFLERELLNKIKYDELEKKYILLQKKINEFQKNEDIRKAEMKTQSSRTIQGRHESDVINCEIEKYEKRNEDLANAINNMTMRIGELEILQKDLNDKSSRSLRSTRSTGTFGKKQSQK